MQPLWPFDPAALPSLTPSTALPANGPGPGTPLLTQIEQILGEEAEPDAAFFLDSWTVGVTAASESYARRQQEQKHREQQACGAAPLSSFMPFFMTEPSSFAIPFEPQRRLNPALAWEDDRAEPEVPWPLTLESACRLLDLTLDSTREQRKAAYRKMASRFHPDRVACTSARERQIASDRMAAINEAYRMLLATSMQRPA